MFGSLGCISKRGQLIIRGCRQIIIISPKIDFPFVLISKNITLRKELEFVLYKKALVFTKYNQPSSAYLGSLHDIPSVLEHKHRLASTVTSFEQVFYEPPLRAYSSLSRQLQSKIYYLVQPKSMSFIYRTNTKVLKTSSVLFND